MVNTLQSPGMMIFFLQVIIFKFAINRDEVKARPDPKGHHQLVPVRTYGGTENLWISLKWPQVDEEEKRKLVEWHISVSRR